LISGSFVPGLKVKGSLAAGGRHGHRCGNVALSWSSACSALPDRFISDRAAGCLALLQQSRCAIHLEVEHVHHYVHQYCARRSDLWVHHLDCRMGLGLEVSAFAQPFIAAIVIAVISGLISWLLGTLGPTSAAVCWAH